MREVPIKYAMQRRFYVYVFFFYLSNSRLPDVKEKRTSKKQKRETFVSWEENCLFLRGSSRWTLSIFVETSLIYISFV